MSNFHTRLGVAVFWFGWPLFWMYLHGSQRTRILVLFGDEILLVNPWIGNGKWALPGGGMHKGETMVEGTLRELHEETGILADSTNLEFLFTRPSAREAGMRFTCHCFVLRLKTRPTHITIGQTEILEAAWFKLKEIQSDRRIGLIAKDIVAAWQSQTF